MKTIFTDNDLATHFLEKVRWPDKVLCVYCQSDKTFLHIEKAQRSRRQCLRCHKSFSVNCNTLFHKTRIPLVKFFQLIKLMYEQKNIRPVHAGVRLQMSDNRVWFMMKRLREATGEHRKLIELIENEAKKESERDLILTG